MNTAPASTPSERLAGFAALLREHGLTVGVAEQQAMLQAVLHFGPLQERPLQAAWRAIACHSHREWQLWADVYERFWHPEKLRGGVKVSGQTRPSRNLRQSVQAMHDQMDAAQQPASQPGSPQTAPQTAGDSASSPHDEQDAGTPRAQVRVSDHQAISSKKLLPKPLSPVMKLSRGAKSTGPKVLAGPTPSSNRLFSMSNLH